MSDNNTQKTNFTRLLWIAVIVICGLWCVFGIGTYFINRTWPTKGQVGDSFGALNCLFSGLAFAGVIISILMQKEELALQREELAATREELKKQADAQQKQEEALRDQVKALQDDRELSIKLKNYEIIDKQIDELSFSLDSNTLDDADRGTLSFKVCLRLSLYKIDELRPEMIAIEYFFDNIDFLVFKTALVFENFEEDNKLPLQPEHRKMLKLKLDTVFAKHFTGDVNSHLDFPKLRLKAEILNDETLKHQVNIFLNNLRKTYVLYLKENSFNKRPI